MDQTVEKVYRQCTGSWDGRRTYETFKDYSFFGGLMDALIDCGQGTAQDLFPKVRNMELTLMVDDDTNSTGVHSSIVKAEVGELLSALQEKIIDQDEFLSRYNGLLADIGAKRDAHDEAKEAEIAAYEASIPHYDPAKQKALMDQIRKANPALSHIPVDYVEQYDSRFMDDNSSDDCKDSTSIILEEEAESSMPRYDPAKQKALMDQIIAANPDLANLRRNNVADVTKYDVGESIDRKVEKVHRRFTGVVQNGVAYYEAFEDTGFFGDLMDTLIAFGRGSNENALFSELRNLELDFMADSSRDGFTDNTGVNLKEEVGELLAACRGSQIGGDEFLSQYDELLAQLGSRRNAFYATIPEGNAQREFIITSSRDRTRFC
ncbi:hypothetical protein HZA97_02210 [Candidatus Woesearchaeota archaeon]|nr:hypothetical protein [Candidatus Woesearchaeota archaeon]